jgi:hypothetical protein
LQSQQFKGGEFLLDHSTAERHPEDPVSDSSRKVRCLRCGVSQVRGARVPADCAEGGNALKIQ